MTPEAMHSEPEAVNESFGVAAEGSSTLQGNPTAGTTPSARLESHPSARLESHPSARLERHPSATPKARKRKRDELGETMVSLLKKDIPTPSSEEYFLLSLVGDLQRVAAHHQYECRQRLMSVVEEYKDLSS